MASAISNHSAARGQQNRHRRRRRPGTSASNGDESVLIYSLPQASRETVVKALIAEIMVDPNYKGSRLFLLVLFCALTHAGWHSDRIWAGYKRLAQDVQKMGYRCSWKTAQRAVRHFLDDFPVLRLITDQEELLEGPGEHDWVDRGHRKKGQGPVNHYDVSELRALLPEELIRVFRYWATEGETKPLPPPPVAPQPARNPDIDYPCEDVFSDPDYATNRVSPPATLPVEKRRRRLTKNTAVSVQASPAPPVSVISTQHDSASSEAPLEVPPSLCNVDDIRSGERVENAPSAKREPTQFDETNLSPVTKRYTRGRGGERKRAKKGVEQSATAATQPAGDSPDGGPDLSPARLLKTRAYRMLFDAGMGMAGALVLLREQIPLRGGDVGPELERFLWELIEYGKWQSQRSGEEKEGGYLLQTARNFPGVWPDGFEAILERDRASRSRIVSAHEAAARTIVTPPLAPSPPEPLPDTTGTDTGTNRTDPTPSRPSRPSKLSNLERLQELPEAERQVLEREAREGLSVKTTSSRDRLAKVTDWRDPRAIGQELRAKMVQLLEQRQGTQGTSGGVGDGNVPAGQGGGRSP